MIKRFPCILLALLCLCLLPLSPAWAQDEESAACIACHGDHAALTAARQDPGRAVEPLLVDGPLFARSVHAGQTCAGCHFDYEDTPHTEDAESVTCTECHDEAGEEFAASVHGEPHEEGGPPRAQCTDCHSVHGVLPVTDRDAMLYPLNVYSVCGKCHFEVDPATATPEQIMHEAKADDAHARGILLDGLAVSATCVSCHGGHEIRHQGDPKSQVSRAEIDRTCAKCHVGVMEQYEESIHYIVSHDPEMNGGSEDYRGATCSDCHPPHEAQMPDAEFVASSIRACSRCHSERGGSFRQSYHGKRFSVGFEGGVASCEACHGNHRTLPAEDPRSMVHPDNIVETCAKCHPDSHEEFAKFLVHADITDAENFPKLSFIYRTMNGLLIGTLILGCLHALLWLIRSLAAGEWRRPAKREGERFIRRWGKAYIGYHIALMGCVLVLATTGLPLHFADQPWASKLMNFFGGAGAAGWVHRVFAVAIMALVAIFVIHMAWRLLVKREKGIFTPTNTMLPRWKDIQDLMGNLRWFLFLAPRPRYSRWTYWEKFDFWAVFWGMFVIGLSGLMLWFPEVATRFVPGWFLNAAVIVHGIEALLDIGFIFTVHVFHANLRPDKFPMDTMFVSGRIPESEFRHERPDEYDELMREGKLEELFADQPTRRSRVIAYVIGTAALAVGFFFLVMMIVAVAANVM